MVLVYDYSYPNEGFFTRIKKPWFYLTQSYSKYLKEQTSYIFTILLDYYMHTDLGEGETELWTPKKWLFWKKADNKNWKSYKNASLRSQTKTESLDKSSTNIKIYTVFFGL